MLGTIPVLEKSVGFDRMLYRLPALLVEDFAMITTELLRDAYIEAAYQEDNFEYHRLSQSVRTLTISYVNCYIFNSVFFL